MRIKDIRQIFLFFSKYVYIVSSLEQRHLFRFQSLETLGKKSNLIVVFATEVILT